MARSESEIEKKAVAFYKKNSELPDKKFFEKFEKEFSDYKAFVVDTGGGFEVGLIPVNNSAVIGIGPQTENVIRYDSKHKYSPDEISEVFYDDDATQTVLFEKFNHGGEIKKKDIIAGAKFKMPSGIIWIIDKVYPHEDFGTAVETSMEGHAKGNYRDTIEEVVAFLNEEKAEKFSSGGMIKGWNGFINWLNEKF